MNISQILLCVNITKLRDMIYCSFFINLIIFVMVIWGVLRATEIAQNMTDFIEVFSTQLKCYDEIFIAARTVFDIIIYYYTIEMVLFYLIRFKLFILALKLCAVFTFFLRKIT